MVECLTTYCDATAMFSSIPTVASWVTNVGDRKLPFSHRQQQIVDTKIGIQKDFHFE